MKKQVKNIEKIYTFGNGKVACGMGVEERTLMPFITVAKLNQPEKITTNLIENQREEFETIVLSFKNIEGFNVLKKMVKKVEERLKEQQKLLK